MSSLSDYKKLFCDGAYLEEIGQGETARSLYRKIVERCALSATSECNALEKFYGQSAYANIGTCADAIEIATVALLCVRLLEVIERKFPARDRIVYASGTDTADIRQFLEWLGTERTPRAADYGTLKSTTKLLLQKEKVQIPSRMASNENLSDLIGKIVNGIWSL